MSHITDCCGYDVLFALKNFSSSHSFPFCFIFAFYFLSSHGCQSFFNILRSGLLPTISPGIPGLRLNRLLCTFAVHKKKIIPFCGFFPFSNWTNHWHMWSVLVSGSHILHGKRKMHYLTAFRLKQEIRFMTKTTSFLYDKHSLYLNTLIISQIVGMRSSLDFLTFAMFAYHRISIQCKLRALVIILLREFSSNFWWLSVGANRLFNTYCSWCWQDKSTQINNSMCHWSIVLPFSYLHA